MTIYVTEPSQRGNNKMLKPQKVYSTYQDGDGLDHLIDMHPEAIYFTDEPEAWDPVPLLPQDVVDTLHRSLWRSYLKDEISQDAYERADNILVDAGCVPTWRQK